MLVSNTESKLYDTETRVIQPRPQGKPFFADEWANTPKGKP
jgi:hypothetical protein